MSATATTIQSTTRARAEALVAELTDNGDLDSLVHLARMIGSAQDALTDDMIGRLAGIAGGGIDMLDRVNRSGVVKALPAIAQMVDNGDLERITHLARLIGSAEDALTDDMVGRLAGIAGGGLDMLDRVNRSGVVKALPAIAQMVDNGDLERITHLARLIGSAEDALTDDMIGRRAHLASEGLSLFDRVTRSDGFMGMLQILERPDVQEAFTAFLEAVCIARTEAKEAAPSVGGLGPMLKLARDPQTQDAMRFMVSMASHLKR
ncbi:hypothetical protein [Acidihalobacter ferrooxydans]|uniref:DUF1641 domain-containing protein n=1 Tax=Acidihalobacter ferrooxydans TaxID=1765967 RepID=A0A1P8UCY5_9GAMM|nr:hypothetical protein [Acidihalobacter ferrooxydans]APZ41717.1 hypothetical protein BW247_00195 [Acidihalobacter ferrooxydans]